MRGCFHFIILLVLATSSFAAEDLTLFVDRSISMNDRFDAAIEGAKLFVQLADDKSSVRIVAFYGEADLSPRFRFSQPAARSAAMAWINKLKPDGSGTDYQSALAAIENERRTVGIFISDGEHGGTEEKLLECIDRLTGRVVLHTVAIDAPEGSDRDTALAKMASRTGGSHARVESSEALLQQLLKLAVQNGNYRGYAPKKQLIELPNVSGRLMAFGLDGQVAVTPSSTVQREHIARLPGENIHLAIVEPPRTTNVRLTLRRGRTKQSRLGTVFVDDLPKHRMAIRNKQASYPPGGQLEVAVTFHDEDGRQVGRLPPGVRAEFATVAVNGKVLSNVPGQTDKGQVDSRITLPTREGVYNLRITSLWPWQGKGFLQSTEHSFVVKKPRTVTLNVSPKRIGGVVPPGAFERVVAVQDVAFRSATSLRARLAGSDIITIEDPKLKNGRMTLRLTAKRPGKANGKVTIRIPLGDQTGVAEVPFQFDVRAPFSEDKAKPVEITTQSRTATFTTPMKSIKVRAASDEIVRFKVEVSPTSKHSGASLMSADFGVFELGGQPSKAVITSTKWLKSNNTIRGASGKVTLEGTILSPLKPGQYTSKLVIKSSTGYSLTIPITLDVRQR